ERCYKFRIERSQQCFCGDNSTPSDGTSASHQTELSRVSRVFATLCPRPARQLDKELCCDPAMHSLRRHLRCRLPRLRSSIHLRQQTSARPCCLPENKLSRLECGLQIRFAQR